MYTTVRQVDEASQLAMDCSMDVAGVRVPLLEGRFQLHSTAQRLPEAAV